MPADIQERLREGWLGQIDRAIADGLIAAGRILQFEDNQTLSGFGEHQQHLYGIAQGTVRMYITMNEREPFLGHIVGPGFWLGDTEVLTGQTGIMEMVASGPTTVCAVSKRAIEALAAKDPKVWHAIAILANMNACIAIGAAEDLTMRDPRQKMAAVLLRLASRRNAFQGTSPLWEIPIRQSELAEACGLSKTVTTEGLGRLSAQGLLQRNYGKIRLLDPEALEKVLSA